MIECKFRIAGEGALQRAIQTFGNVIVIEPNFNYHLKFKMAFCVKKKNELHRRTDVDDQSRFFADQADQIVGGNVWSGQMLQLTQF